MSQIRFRRSLYQENQRLTAADLENQQQYDREKRQMLHRTLYGAGVIDGFAVQYDADCSGILLSPGLALDHLGRELYLAEERLYPADALYKDWPDSPGEGMLCLQYTEQTVGEGYVLQPDGTHQSVPNRMAEDVELVCHPEDAVPEECLMIARCRMHRDAAGLPQISAIYPAAKRPTIPSGTASGVLTIPTADFGDGGIVYSDEISHGLGAGTVVISLSVEGWMDHRACLVSGETELFLHGLKTAVLLYPEDGTFRAAIHRRAGHHGGALRIFWHAVRSNVDDSKVAYTPPKVPMPAFAGAKATAAAFRKESALPPAEEHSRTMAQNASNSSVHADTPQNLPKHCTLEPRVAFLYPGETADFQLCGENGFLSSVSLRFQAENGVIDERGHYAAPDQEGVYQVCAVAADQQTYWATVFVKKRR